MMNKKADAERAIRHLALEWMQESGYQKNPVIIRASARSLRGSKASITVTI
jgi:DNA-binding LacI/PurR family transcriptional regulator